MKKETFESLKEGLAQAAGRDNWRDCRFHVSEEDFIKNFDKYIETDAIYIIHRENKRKCVMIPYTLWLDMKSSS